METSATTATLSRPVQRPDRASVLASHRTLFQQCVRARDRQPGRLIPDFDPSDNPLRGDQMGSLFHSYRDHYCFLRLYVFCGLHLPVSYLRHGFIDPAQHAWAILSLSVMPLLQRWLKVENMLRADSTFCR